MCSMCTYSYLTLFLKLESIFRLQGYQWKTPGLRADRSVNEAKVGTTQFCASLRGRAVPQETIHLQGMRVISPTSSPFILQPRLPFLSRSSWTERPISRPWPVITRRRPRPTPPPSPFNSSDSWPSIPTTRSKNHPWLLTLFQYRSIVHLVRSPVAS